MKTNLVIFGTKNFNNSFNEIKEDLGFSLIYYDLNKFSEPLPPSVSAIIIDNNICEDKRYLSAINEILNKPILLLEDQNCKAKCTYNEKISLPVNFVELKNKIIHLVTSYKFNENSSIKIKEYILDKNEKKIKKKKYLYNNY